MSTSWVTHAKSRFQLFFDSGELHYLIVERSQRSKRASASHVDGNSQGQLIGDDGTHNTFSFSSACVLIGRFSHFSGDIDETLLEKEFQKNTNAAAAKKYMKLKIVHPLTPTLIVTAIGTRERTD